MLISMLIGALASLALTTGRQAEWSSASDRNKEQALGVAEAGVHKVVERLSAQLSATPAAGEPDYWHMTPGSSLPASCPAGGTCSAAETNTNFSGTTPQGRYWFWVNRTAQGFLIDAQSRAGGTTLDRSRHVQVALLPPSRFKQNKAYALFSKTDINIDNNDQVLDGDVYALNGNITILNSNQDPTLRGSLTSATSYIQLGSGVRITGDAWSGGFYCARDSSGICITGGERWAMNLAGGARVDGAARASSTTPNCPGGTDFNVVMGSGSSVSALTTPGIKTGAGTVPAAAYKPNTCTAAAPPEEMPVFDFNPKNYESVLEFSSVSAFQTWLGTNGGNFRGTFLVHQLNPTQAGRIDLTGVKMTGSTTLVTDAPVYTGNLDDSLVTDPNAAFVIVSHYTPADPPNPEGCSTEKDASDCAVHIKNNFALNADGKCKTATLVYADNGPVAIKNGQTMCGSVISNKILVKNNQRLQYDMRIDRVVGFASESFEITQWKELPSS